MITYSMSQGLVQMWQSVMIINILNLEIEGKLILENIFIFYV